ncbi:MAG: CidA/LrgA family protein [Pseudomonadota bacterium]
MLKFLTLILGCQLAGEFITGSLSIPVPGPVLGMVLLFTILVIRKELPPDLDRTQDGLLRSMSLLFVPAGAGVILHFQILGEALLPLGLGLVVSTVATIAVTAFLMDRLGRATDRG